MNNNDLLGAMNDYYHDMSSGSGRRNDEFCGNYDPKGKGNAQRGYQWLKDNGLDTSTTPPANQYLGRHTDPGKQQEAFDQFMHDIRPTGATR